MFEEYPNTAGFFDILSSLIYVVHPTIMGLLCKAQLLFELRFFINKP
jgi:hypothetical protein